MASIYIPPQRSYWYASYRDANGRQHNVSTGILHSPQGGEEAIGRNRAAAQKYADELERSARRRSLESPPDSGITGSVESYVEYWLELRRPALLPDSHQSLCFVMKHYFLPFIAARAIRQLNEFSPKDMMAFKDHLKSSFLSPSTIDSAVAAVSGMFFHALNNGVILAHPMPKNPREKYVSHLLQDLSTGSVDQLLRATQRVDWRTTILCGYYTAFSCPVVICIVWSAVDLQRDELTVQIPRGGLGGCVKARLPIHPTFKAHLTTIPHHSSGWLSPNLATASPSLRIAQFKRILAAGGVNPPPFVFPSGRHCRRITWMCLRKSAVEIMKKAGVAQKVIKAFVTPWSHGSEQLFSEVREAVFALPRLNVPTSPLQHGIDHPH